jgi:hypothetical protein
VTARRIIQWTSIDLRTSFGIIGRAISAWHLKLHADLFMDVFPSPNCTVGKSAQPQFVSGQANEPSEDRRPKESCAVHALVILRVHYEVHSFGRREGVVLVIAFKEAKPRGMRVTLQPLPKIIQEKQRSGRGNVRPAVARIETVFVN